jgi:hypothetical protein
MDIHKPKLVQNWRELFKEWGIIVLGVLTALLAEQAVQSIEWRHKVEAAITDMDNELSKGDGPQAYVRLAVRNCVANRLDSIRSAVESGDRARSGQLIDGLWLPRRTWDFLAREAANTADVASHMPADQMLQYRIAYEMVPTMNQLAQKELADVGHLRALPRTGGTLETAEKLAAIDAVEELRVDSNEMTRESDFLLGRIHLMRIRLDRAAVRRNLDGLPREYRTCLAAPYRFLNRS